MRQPPCSTHQLAACDAWDDGHIRAGLREWRNSHICLPAAHLQRLTGQRCCLLGAVAKVHHVLAGICEDLLGKAQEVPTVAGCGSPVGG
jgi:hypothetical protein